MLKHKFMQVELMPQKTTLGTFTSDRSKWADRCENENYPQAI